MNEETQKEPESSKEEFSSLYNEYDKLSEKEKALEQERYKELATYAIEPSIDEVNRLRKKTKTSLHVKKQDIASFIIDELSNFGLWYYTEALDYYFFYLPKKELINIKSHFFALLLHKFFGLNPSTSEFEFIIFEIIAKTHNYIGKETKIYKVCHYDRGTNVLYIYNNGSLIYKVAKDKITQNKNGVDGVLFLKNSYAKEWSVDLGVKRNRNKLNIILDNPNYSKDSLLKEEEAKQIFRAWFFYMFFLDLYPTKPILAFIGEKGSAKTMSLKLIKALFYGKEKSEIYSLGDNRKEVEEYVSGNFFHFFDNQDSKPSGRRSWVEDFLATLSTGLEIERRKLYTNLEMLRLEIRGIPAITARTPYFRRDDVADRLLILELDRIETFKAEKALLHELEKNRDEIWEEVLLELALIIGRLNEEQQIPSITFRLADFASFLYQTSEDKGITEKVLKKLGKNQDQFTLEENPIFQALQIWLEEDGLFNIEHTAKALFNALKEKASNHNIDYFPRSLASFSKRFNNIKSNIKSYYKLRIGLLRTKTKTYMFSKL